MRDDRLEVAGEALPDLEIDQAFTGAVGLVEARAVIERRDAVEPKRDIGARADEFGAFEHARLQAGEDLARRRGLRRRAEPAIHLAPQPERADLEALEVVQALQLAPEPAAHADPGIAAHERLDPEGRVNVGPPPLPP